MADHFAKTKYTFGSAGASIPGGAAARNGPAEGRAAFSAYRSSQRLGDQNSQSLLTLLSYCISKQLRHRQYSHQRSPKPRL